ncbi:hypothetical protein PMG11_01812 [Penicillium brasilianum]|uniref:Helicase C-terminal domain-containing protein n=1 Tax=Penicillium brasilianum TaxID=104259 RepID=A0A0F7TGB7_PENBI|nr:hypothetical protein PMG11_01812 [Penicillium brasilianum]
MVAWMVEMFVVQLGLRTVSITASKSAEERAAAVAEFTSPRSGCEVLITTYDWGATGLNLHGNYHIVVLIENALNYNLETQAIGRVHRIGQAKPQRANRLFQEHTICRYLHYNNFNKIRPQIAAQYRDAFEEEVERSSGLNSQDPDAKFRHIHKVCEDKLRGLMGLQKNFPGFLLMADKKDLNLDSESISKRNADPGRVSKPAAAAAPAGAPADPAPAVPAAPCPAAAAASASAPKKRKAGEVEARPVKRLKANTTKPAEGNKVAQITGQVAQGRKPQSSSRLFASRPAPKTPEDTPEQSSRVFQRLRLKVGPPPEEAHEEAPKKTPALIAAFAVIPGEVPRARLADYVSQTARELSKDTGLRSSKEEGDSGEYEVDESEDESDGYQTEEFSSRQGHP